MFDTEILSIIHRPGRVFEIVGFWPILLVNPPLQESRAIGHDISR